MRGGSPLRPGGGGAAGGGGGGKGGARSALPRLGIALGRELRRALGDQGFRFADEGAALDGAGEDDLATAAERIGNRAGVGDREALTAAVAVDDAKGDAAALVADRAFDDFAGHLVAGPGRGGEQL